MRVREPLPQSGQQRAAAGMVVTVEVGRHRLVGDATEIHARACPEALPEPLVRLDRPAPGPCPGGRQPGQVRADTPGGVRHRLRSHTERPEEHRHACRRIDRSGPPHPDVCPRRVTLVTGDDEVRPTEREERGTHGSVPVPRLLDRQPQPPGHRVQLHRQQRQRDQRLGRRPEHRALPCRIASLGLRGRRGRPIGLRVGKVDHLSHAAQSIRLSDRRDRHRPARPPRRSAPRSRGARSAAGCQWCLVRIWL